MSKYAKHGTVLALWKPRFVTHVGYDTDFSSALAKTLYEASPTFFQDCVRRPDERLMMNKEIVQVIIENHPIFAGFRDSGRAACGAWLSAAEKGYRKDQEFYQTLRTHRASMTDVLEREMVRAFVTGQVDAAMREGNCVRKIHFGELASSSNPDGSHMTEDWRGPWRVEKTVRKLTGEYFPACGSEDDYEPAGLSDVKHHTMYLMQNESAYGNWYHGKLLLVMPEDTVPWHQYKDARQVANVVSEV